MSQVIAFGHSGITAEGDNCVLMQKVTKELLDMVVKGTFKLPSPSYHDYSKAVNVNTVQGLYDLILYFILQFLMPAFARPFSSPSS
jgi:acyl-CoA oxidase